VFRGVEFTAFVAFPALLSIPQIVAFRMATIVLVGWNIELLSEGIIEGQ
jgi:hypothetical protein